MQKYKKLLLLIMVVVVGFIVTACNGSGDDTVLRVINFRVEDRAFYEWMNDEFEKENPGVRIEYDAVDTSNYPQLLSSRMTSGDLDVFFGEPHNVFDGSRSGSMLPLDDMDISDSIIDEYLSTGKLYNTSTEESNQLMLPLNITGTVVFYNKAIFAENNIEVPTNWDEFVNVLNSLDQVSEVEAPILYGGRDQWPSNMILNAVEAQIVRSDQPDFYQKIREWDDNPEYRFDNDLWMETFDKTNTIFNYVQRNATGLSYANVPSLFVTGNPQTDKFYPMIIDGTWSGAQILNAQPDFEVGTFILPSNDDADKNQFLPFKPGAGISVFEDSENIDLAKAYVNFHFQEDVYERYLEETLFGSIMTDIPQTHPLMESIFDGTYDPIVIAENSIVPGMPWETSEGLTNLLLGSVTAEELADNINSSIASQKTVWDENIDLVNEKPE